MNDEKIYELWLAMVDGLGPVKLAHIHNACVSAREVFFMKEELVEKIYGLEKTDVESILNSRRGCDPAAEYEAMIRSGVRMILQEEEEYPASLRQIKDPPAQLFVRGRLPDQRRPRVAVVGARECSEYGKAMAKTIGETLARSGVQVISGMAKGVDSYAHLGALRAERDTYAVLGCGVSICYPASSKSLYEELPEKGGVLSEYPPKEKPRPGSFPVRNRIISGLSDAVVVVEARVRSGSLITADHALTQGKEVYALPGRIIDPLSGGTNRLIAQGAFPVISMEDLLKNLRLSLAAYESREDKSPPALPEKEAKVYRRLSLFPKGLEELLAETKYPLPELSKILIRLASSGFCEESFKNSWRRKI
ncbi:MAG: DNA-processing protein DprA [Lachnospiraceae bacterium]|nr:DNA-processing protein DprA [Lachnospiraceae bacterium]